MRNRYTESTLALPFLFLTILTALGGCRLYRTAVLNRYLALTGTVLQVERTAILRRPKALLIETEGKALRVVLRGRHWAPAEGGRITLYVADTAPIYEWRGIHQLSSYLTLARSDASPGA